MCVCVCEHAWSHFLLVWILVSERRQTRLGLVAEASSATGSSSKLGRDETLCEIEIDKSGFQSLTYRIGPISPAPAQNRARLIVLQQKSVLNEFL